ncbi:hypothetical protein DWX88_22765 [Bacteroides xylanisolvens]|nr:hypothetical protein DWX88_22765 [Bacteroides xylanisolvens]
MKKNTLGIALALIIAFAGYNIHESQSKKELLIGLVSSNVEALARGEGGGVPCGGPKTSITGTCKSQNDYNCKDNRGCQ